jgi:hypothetical protein
MAFSALSPGILQGKGNAVKARINYPPLHHLIHQRAVGKQKWGQEAKMGSGLGI